MILMDHHNVMPHDTHSVHLWHPQLVWCHMLLFDCNINMFDLNGGMEDYNNIPKLIWMPIMTQQSIPIDCVLCHKWSACVTVAAGDAPGCTSGV